MISWKSATESSRNNDGDAEEDLTLHIFTFSFLYSNALDYLNLLWI